ncbi:hypothetical protein Tco_0032461 [Tanacetum coccineum]
MSLCGCNCADTMADVNVNAPAEQAPTMAPPTPTGIVRFLPSDALRSHQVKITLVDNNKPFSSLPTPDALINFVNDLGYTKVVRTISAVVTNDLHQPWRALTTIINLCLMGKTSGFERPRASVLQILWGVVNRAHIDYAERMWEEFTQSIHSFVEDKKNLALHTQGKKKSNPIVILSYVLGYLKFSSNGTKREVFGMPIPNDFITADIRGGQYYNAYLEKVAKHQRYLTGEEGSDPESHAPKPDKATKPKETKKSKPLAPKAAPVTEPAAAKASKSTSSQQPKPKLAPAKPQEKKQKLVKETSDEPSLAKSSKSGLVTKKRKPTSSLRLVDEFVDEGIPENEPRFDDEEADMQRAVEESLKVVHAAHRGPLPPVVFREPDSGDVNHFQRFRVREREEDEKVTLAEVETDTEELLIPTEKSGEEVSNTVVLGTESGGQDEKQGGPDPSDSAESRPLPSQGIDTGSSLDPMDEGFIATAYPNVQENLKLTVEEQVILEEPASSTGTLSSLQHLAKDFSFGDQFFNDKPSEAENEKTTAETEDESMVSVTIQQDSSAIPPMTTPRIDLISRPDSPNVHRPLPATTTAIATATTTTTILPPPPQPQQSTTDSILIKRIGELEQIMANLIHDKSQLEERLDKHGSRLYKLENLDIPHQVSKAVDEIVTDAVDWAIQAPLRDRFRDLPEADMKEILHHRMWESNSYKAHEDHKKLYEALEKSMDRDQTDQLLTDLAEARRKKKRRHDSPKTPPGSPPHQPPPPPPPAAAPSSSKTAASAEYTAWMTIDTRLKPSVSSIPEDLHMDDDSTLDEQVHLSDDEDIGNDHIPKVNLKQDWWKPLSEEDRPATPEPAWSIPSSDLPVPMNNWASALASTYAPLPENSLIALTGDMAMFMDWYCKNQGITKLKQKDLEGPAFEIVKVFHPNMIHLQFQMEEFHKLLIDRVDDAITRYGSKGGRPALSISKMKAAYYPDVGLEQMVPDQMWIKEECKYDIVAMYVFSLYGYDYMKKIVLRRADLKEHIIMERDFKYLYSSDFEDLYLLNLQGHLDHLPPKDKKILTIIVNLWTRNLVIRQRYKHEFTVIESPRAVTFRDKYGVQMIMRFNEIHKFSDGTLHQIDEALDYSVKEFKVNRMNLGLNTRFWTRKDVERNKEFMFSIQKWLKTRRISRNLESFVGGRVREGDYRLL